MERVLIFAGFIQNKKQVQNYKSGRYNKSIKVFSSKIQQENKR